MPTPLPASRSCFALVPCAGTGTRAGGVAAKQYAAIAGVPLVLHTLRALANVDRLEMTLVVVAPGDLDFERRVAWPVRGRFALARCGGPTRAASVAAGLAELARLGALADDWILVHDAARCLVRSETIDALIDACLDDAVGGLLAVPLADTLKRETSGRVEETVPRAHLWQAQTPQMFRLGMLAEALARAGVDVTDEASAIEQLGLGPRLVSGEAANFKVTRPGDFAIAEALLQARAR